MKLAEVLIKIKDLKGKASELHRAICDETSFDIIDELMEIPSIEDSISQLVSVSQEIASLKSRISRTNAKHGLTDKLNKMESLRSLIHQLSTLSQHKQTSVSYQHGYSENPIKIKTQATYDVEIWTKQLDEWRKEIRLIDLELQRLNWEVDLVD